jgi:hypothetical protein
MKRALIQHPLRQCLALLLGLAASSAGAAEIPKAAVPSSPYIGVVYRYADAMIERGRDTYGPQKTGLFLSALDRATMSPLTNRPVAPDGIRKSGRVSPEGGPLAGANPYHDGNLLRLLYMLSELSAKPRYREAADAELKWLLKNAGGLTAWDVIKDEPVVTFGHESFRPWMLWDRCFDLAPEIGAKLIYSAGGPGGESAREAGFHLRTLAVAQARTRDQQFARTIEGLLKSIEGSIGTTNSSVADMLSLAIDCDGAAHRVSEPLALRLRALANRIDETFCAMPHDLEASGGFITDPMAGSARSPLWKPEKKTTAQLGMMCVSRYDNTANVSYRDLVHSAADAYLNSLPGENEDTWPSTFGQAISLELAAWRSTANARYLTRARALADFAMQRFFDAGPLPRASLESGHYETITGADTLALALAELHLQVLHITAVRCPPNTIDR